MVTKKRKEALQWFHDRGEVPIREAWDHVSTRMVNSMMKEGQINTYVLNGMWHYSLTDLGRRVLHDG